MLSACSATRLAFNMGSEERDKLVQLVYKSFKMEKEFFKQAPCPKQLI